VLNEALAHPALAQTAAAALKRLPRR
jgi:hypothetical protein